MVRNVGIGGFWLVFFLSGVHATIAAVLAAFTIPPDVKISDKGFVTHITALVKKFECAHSSPGTLVSFEQLHVLEDIRTVAKQALTLLQRLEHAMHPFVAFFVMPVFALANAGISFPADILSQLSNPVTIGVALGLLGKGLRHYRHVLPPYSSQMGSFSGMDRLFIFLGQPCWPRWGSLCLIYYRTRL